MFTLLNLCYFILLSQSASSSLLAPRTQVCAITGRCFANLLTEREEHAGEWERGQGRGGDAPAEEEEWGEGGVSSRLGRAFVAGYSCENDADFFKLTGYRIGR